LGEVAESPRQQALRGEELQAEQQLRLMVVALALSLPFPRAIRRDQCPPE
jgi:hypothetical protein